VRVRPPLPRELKGYRPYQCTAAVDESNQSVMLSENLAAVQNGTGTTQDGMLYATYRWGHGVEQATLLMPKAPRQCSAPPG
jgi:kinesin family protein 3/17